MKHVTIRTNNHILFVDLEELEEGDMIVYWIDKDNYHFAVHNNNSNKSLRKHKVLACYPKIIGIPEFDELPDLSNGLLQNHLRVYVDNKKSQEECVGFIDGYKTSSMNSIDKNALLSECARWNNTYGVITMKDINTIVEGLSGHNISFVPEFDNKNNEKLKYIERDGSTFICGEWK